MLMLEELRQGFLQTFPELAKNPKASSMCSSDKRFLLEICAKYNAIQPSNQLAEAKQHVEATTNIMKSNVLNMMQNAEQAQASIC